MSGSVEVELVVGTELLEVELVVGTELLEVELVVGTELLEVELEQVRVPVPTQPVALASVSAEAASAPSARAAKAALSNARQVLIGCCPLMVYEQRGRARQPSRL